jgi:hypothetical protein
MFMSKSEIAKAESRKTKQKLRKQKAEIHFSFLLSAFFFSFLLSSFLCPVDHGNKDGDQFSSFTMNAINRFIADSTIVTEQFKPKLRLIRLLQSPFEFGAEFRVRSRPGRFADLGGNRRPGA